MVVQCLSSVTAGLNGDIDGRIGAGLEYPEFHGAFGENCSGDIDGRGGGPDGRCMSITAKMPAMVVQHEMYQ